LREREERKRPRRSRLSFFLLSLSRFFSFLFVSSALLQPTHVLVGLKLAPELLCLR